MDEYYEGQGGGRYSKKLFVLFTIKGYDFSGDGVSFRVFSSPICKT